MAIPPKTNSKKEHAPQVLSAYDLFEGDVIYLAKNGTPDNMWARQFAEARVFTEASEADAALTLAEAKQDEIIGPYLTNAAIAPDGTPRPTHFREVFRATGPSDRFIGKQTVTPSDIVQTEAANVRL